MIYEKYEDNSPWKVGALYRSPSDVDTTTRMHKIKWLRFVRRAIPSAAGQEWAKIGWWQPKDGSCHLVYLGCFRILSWPYGKEICYRFMAMDGCCTIVHALDPETLANELELTVEPA